MDQQYSTGTVDRPIRPTDGPGPSEQCSDLVDDVSESSSSWANSVLGNMEFVIQRYPVAYAAPGHRNRLSRGATREVIDGTHHVITIEMDGSSWRHSV